MEQEQADELEALQAIYAEDEFSLLEGRAQPTLRLRLAPTVDFGAKKWVSLTLEAGFPPGYPSRAPARLELAELRGVDERGERDLRARLARAQAEHEGAPCVYGVAEALREWLTDNNRKPSDGSAFDEMMRREAAEKSGGAAAAAAASWRDPSAGALAAQRGAGGASATEAEAQMRREAEAARKRLEGTPVTRESFLAWRAKFEAEAEAAARAAAEEAAAAGKASAASVFVAHKAAAGRLTGRQLFESDASLAQSDLGAGAAAGDDEGDDVDYAKPKRKSGVAGAGAGAGGAAGAGDEEDDEDDEDYVEGEDDDEDDDDDEGDDDDEDEDEDEDDS